MKWAIYGMIYLGAALMVYNVYSSVCYARRVRKMGNWDREGMLLRVPIALLVLFLLGYVAVGLFGRPDIIVSGILFGGSIFVFIIFLLLHRITDRIHANEQLRARLLAIEESDRVKASILSTMSHEMRTPMNAIIGMDAIALRNPALPDQTREQLETIGEYAHRLLGMIDDILDISRFESDRMTLKDDVFSLREALDALDSLIRERCDAAGIRYSRRIGGQLDDWYRGDAAMLRRALLCVLENAVKFTPRGGEVAFVIEPLPPEDGRRPLRFTVRDTGTGIDAAFLPRLFEPFTRENDTSATQYDGNGLGLAIAMHIVRRMGGDITVESERGLGSAFTLTATLAAADGPSDPVAAPQAEPAGDDIPLAGRRILIVEDVDMNAEIIADLLDMESIASDRAENGQVAVERFAGSAENHYDAILMDLRMPFMDGLDATRAIRAMNRPDAGAVPIIALTANAFDEDRSQALEAGMDDFLAKPADVDMLFGTLRRQIARRETAR